MKPNALYYANSTPITKKNFVNALKEVGVNKGDIIMVHSSISSFGKLGTFEKDFLLQSLIDSLKESVGNKGIIIMPTFTYSFFKNEPYDVKNSKSTVGVLTEYFRKQPDVNRTIHPTHSVAICGRHKDMLLNIGKDSFDKASIFGKLHQMNGKIVFLGVPFHKACTFIHYIEQIHGVPYRYMKKIEGKIINGNKKYEDEFDFYYKYACFFNSFLNFEKHLLKKGLIKEVKIGHSTISMIQCDDLLKEGCKLLEKDIFFLLRNDKAIFKLINNGLYFFLVYIPWPLRILNEAGANIFRFFKSAFKSQKD